MDWQKVYDATILDADYHYVFVHDTEKGERFLRLYTNFFLLRQSTSHTDSTGTSSAAAS